MIMVELSRRLFPCLAMACTLACSSSDGGGLRADETGGDDDAASVAPDDAEPRLDVSIGCGPCAEGQACIERACRDLPKSCPCPGESYCDLTTKTCRAGCIVDDVCGPGRVCELTKRQCKSGCRKAAECPDDGNPCTDAKCVEGDCQHLPTSSGPDSPAPKACGVIGTGTCAIEKWCHEGRCEAGSGSSLATCESDGNPCTLDVCSGSTCAHTAVPDLATCATFPGSAPIDGPKFDHSFDACLKGTCRQPKAVCYRDSPKTFACFLQSGASLKFDRNVVVATCSETTNELVYWQTGFSDYKTYQKCSVCKYVDALKEAVCF